MNSPLLQQAVEALKPCPFCGDSARIYFNGTYWAALCNKCEGEGPPSDHEGGAIAYWNGHMLESALQQQEGKGEAELPSVPALVPAGQVVAWMWQHEETGGVGFIDQWQIDNGWQAANPRLRLIRPLAFAPSPSTAVQQEARPCDYLQLARECGSHSGNGSHVGFREEAWAKFVANLTAGVTVQQEAGNYSRLELRELAALPDHAIANAFRDVAARNYSTCSASLFRAHVMAKAHKLAAAPTQQHPSPQNPQRGDWRTWQVLPVSDGGKENDRG